MKVLPESIFRLFNNKDSKLHLVYFVDHAKTRTMTLSRIPVILALFTLCCSALGIVFGSLYLNSQIRENRRLTRNAERAKGELLSYQLRYDRVWEKAYPQLEATPEVAQLSVDNAKEPETAVIAAIADKITESKPVPVAPEKIESPPTVTPTIPENKTPASQNKPNTNIAAKSSTKPTKIEVSTVIVKEKPSAFFIDFDLYNLDKSAKAKGLFWARIILENGSHKKLLVSHQEAENLVEGQSPDSQIPTFSVRKFRRCHLEVEKPAENYGRPVSAEIIISDRRGSIIHRQVVDLKKNIAIKNQGKNNTIQ